MPGAELRKINFSDRLLMSPKDGDTLFPLLAAGLHADLGRGGMSAFARSVNDRTGYQYFHIVEHNKNRDQLTFSSKQTIPKSSQSAAIMMRLTKPKGRLIADFRVLGGTEWIKVFEHEYDESPDTFVSVHVERQQKSACHVTFEKFEIARLGD